MMQISQDEAQNKKAIQAYVEAFNAGDFDRLRSLFAPPRDGFRRARA